MTGPVAIPPVRASEAERARDELRGTLVNGWRVAGPQQVRPGDRLPFGLATVVVSRR